MDGLPPQQDNLESVPISTTGFDTPGTGETEKKAAGKGWLFGLGCMGCGLVGCLGTVLLIVVIGVGGMMWVFNNIFSKTPMDVPPTEISAQEEKDLEQRLKSFKEQLNKSEGQDVSLELTTQELNYTFQKSSEKSKVKMFVEILDEDQVKFIMSVPMSQEQSTVYMNMVGEGKISVSKGKFETDFKKLTMGKVKMPEGDFLKGFSQGIGEEIDKNEVYQKLPYKLQELKIKDGKFLLKFKMKSSGADVTTPGETGSPPGTTGKEKKDKGVTLE